MRVLNDAAVSAAKSVTTTAVHAAVASSGVGSLDDHNLGVFYRGATQQRRLDAATSSPSQKSRAQSGFDRPAFLWALAGREARHDLATDLFECCFSARRNGVTVSFPQSCIANPRSPDLPTRVLASANHRDRGQHQSGGTA